jgi:hypothetical protein
VTARTLKNELPVLDRATLAAMPTKGLLDRRRRLLRCEESPDVSDASPDELAQVTGIVFKSAPEWRAAYEQLKAILATREHVPKSTEKRAARIERARANRSAEHRRQR